MVAFGGVVVYETPDGRRWVALEDFDELRSRARLSENEAVVLEWAIRILTDTVQKLEGNWDSRKSKKDCENARRATVVMGDILERLS